MRWGWGGDEWGRGGMGMSALSLSLSLSVCPAELVLVVSGGCMVELIEFHVVCVGRVLPRHWV